MSEVKIAEFRNSHLSEVATLEQQCFQDPWPKASFKELLPEGTSWIALVNNDIVGYIVTQWVLDEIHILNIAVAEQYRQQKIGSSLLQYILDRGKTFNSTSLFLEVRVSNNAAIAFYTRFGFEQISTRKKYYQNGEDAYIMYRSLPVEAGVV